MKTADQHHLGSFFYRWLIPRVCAFSLSLLYNAVMSTKQIYLYPIGKSRLLLSFLLLMGLTSGCDESRKISSAVLATQTSGEPVVQATKDALKIIGYQVVEKNDTRNTGEWPRAIHAERMGMVTAFGPATVHIQVVVTPLAKGSQIQVDVIPPKGAYGSTALPLHDFQYALSQLIPDLSLKSRKVPKEWL